MWDLFVFKLRLVVNEVWGEVIGQKRFTVQSQTKQTQAGQI